MTSRLATVLGAAFAGLVMSGSAFAAAEAADKSLGMALLAATVDIDGSLVAARSSGALSAQKDSKGVYRLKFARSLDTCTMTYGTEGEGFAFLIDAGGPDVLVGVTDANGAAKNFPVSIIAFCPR